MIDLRSGFFCCFCFFASLAREGKKLMQQSIVTPTPPTSGNSGGKWGIFLLLTRNFPSPGRGFLFHWSPTPVCGALGGGNRGVRHIEYRNEIRTPSGPSELHVLLVASHNLVPRVFSLSNMAAAGEKNLAHSELKRSLIGAFHGAFIRALSLVHSFQNKDGYPLRAS